jgi:hypothetical protein
VSIKLKKAGLLLALSLFFISYSISAQQHERITPLHEFFQANYDSTIIYHSWSNWYSAPNFLIVARHKDKLYYFTYTSPYKNLLGRYFPGNISQKFMEEENKFERTVPDTNRYLLSKDILQETLGKYWNELQAANLWKLKDDKHSLTSTGNCMIADGNTNTFYLINKEGIKVLNFYEPAYWEECLGKDINRQRAIKARAMFQRIAKED